MSGLAQTSHSADERVLIPRVSTQPAVQASRAIAWRAGPTKPGPLDLTVDIWRADLVRVDPSLGRLLSRGERERSARIARAPQRELWQRSRGLLRALLARYVQADPRELRIAVGRHGKPELVDTHADLWFNLSHSGKLALYAIAADGPVGVDVEAARDPTTRGERDHVALAAHSFGGEQARRLALLDPNRREAEFLRLWTRYEAELKRRGTGLGGHDQPAADEDGSWIVDLDVGPTAAAALACTVAPRELRRWRWA